MFHGIVLLNGKTSAPVARPEAQVKPMPVPLPELLHAAQRLGRTLFPHEAEGLQRYLELLLSWRRRINLVGATDWPSMLTLIQDSWHLADLLQEWGQPVERSLDLGAGAGLPGIPLRLFWSAGHYLLVEPRAKRAIFLRQAVAELNLPHTAVMQSRMEDLPLSARRVDLVVARAFRPPAALLSAAREVLGPGGAVVLMTRKLPPLPEDYVLLAHKRYNAREATQGLFLVQWRGGEGSDFRE